MSYIPPHLRAAAATPSPSPTAASPSTHHWGVTVKPSTGNLEAVRSLPSPIPRDGAAAAAASFLVPGRRPGADGGLLASQHSRVLSVPEPVFNQWKPSDRVLALSPEQIEEVRLRLNVEVEVSSDSLPSPAPIESFNDMCLHSSIMKDIAFHEYTRPTSIQAQAMPVALSGRDLLGCAETGSGKTAAFTIPMIQHCLAQPPLRHGDGPLALVLAPTRELAQQIEKEVKAFIRSLEALRTAIVVGGTNISEQRSELRAGVHVVVATLGRFIDHLQQGNTSLLRISFVVLDEADKMLDMGFEPQIREVMRNLPRKHQTLLFSATMPVEIEELAQEYLSNPVQTKVGKVSSPAANVCQILEKVAESEKIDHLLALLVDEASQAENFGRAYPLTIVFVDRKSRCEEVAEALVAQGLDAVVLHGGRTQSEREAALHDFRKGSTNILVATDVASRGLDVTGVAHVVNLDLPRTMEDYVHRIGRTGRGGSTGRATSFYIDRDMYLVAQIRKAIADVESGNSVAYATGKIARKKEREAAAAHREARLALSRLSLNGPASINIEDKYRYMLTTASLKKEGAADDAWNE
ncbi:DEAD-box ATP-dependent RNA helicase 20-like [Cocos nucifera]|uniref:DEAD-box ATP-dependent RNA helicase 20-like n=1 Tax=Cocos nucifera TaxID=13894 RepID=A0A8K0I594_COCNU|nr:DEAD-box ATP-dependent RNA helicase 20-like [Cocos nucifera]